VTVLCGRIGLTDSFNVTATTSGHYKDTPKWFSIHWNYNACRYEKYRGDDVRQLPCNHITNYTFEN